MPNVVDRGVLQAMWGGTCGQSWTPWSAPNHVYVKTL